MAAYLASRVMKARRESVCPDCKMPIRPGQLIAKCGTWMHATCLIRHQHHHRDHHHDRRAMTVSSDPRVQFRGYPVTHLSPGVQMLMAKAGNATELLLTAVRYAVDTAEPGEPSGWLFTSAMLGQEVWIERFGGVRDDTGHHDGQWSVFLPHER
jgi:hypothetical protein